MTTTMPVMMQQLLDIPGVRVLSVEINEQEINLQVESTQHWAICHKCGRRATEHHCDGEKLRLRHLPVFNRPVYLTLQTKRYRCLHCNDRPTTTQRGDWYDTDAHCTTAFADHRLLEVVGSTLSEVERKHGVSYHVLRGLLLRRVSARVDWTKIKQLRILGIDDISLLKGHRDFVTTVSTQDEAGHPVGLAVLDGREKETVAAFLPSLPEELRAQVEQACTDMYAGDANAVKEVWPHADLVIDRFHVAKGYRSAVDDLRKSEMKEVKASLKPEEDAGFKGVMWMLRRNSDDLTTEEQQLLELLFEGSPLLRKAYKLREKLTAIFETKDTKESARQAIHSSIQSVKCSGLACFDKFLVTLDNWMDEITNYFISRQTSGWVEGFNNKIKVLKRRCYGINSAEMLFRRLFLDPRGAEAFTA